jgi:hypothetical protein
VWHLCMQAACVQSALVIAQLAVGSDYAGSRVVFLKTWVCYLTSVPHLCTVNASPDMHLHTVYHISHSCLQITVGFPILDSVIMHCTCSLENIVQFAVHTM